MPRVKIISYQKFQQRRIEDTLMNRVRLATAFVNTETRRRCPVDTGNLMGSYTSKVFTEGGEIVGQVGTNVEYGPHVEFGTRKWPGGKPHLRPALDDNRSQIKKFIRGG